MLYRKRYWNEIGREKGWLKNHPLLNYALGLLLLAALAIAGLNATHGGLLTVHTELNTVRWSYKSLPSLTIYYKLDYGLHDVCSEATATYLRYGKPVAVTERKCSSHHEPLKFTGIAGLPLTPKSETLWMARLGIMAAHGSVLVLLAAFLVFALLLSLDL
jgi:hypothetical protein